MAIVIVSQVRMEIRYKENRYRSRLPSLKGQVVWAYRTNAEKLTVGT